jgi:magnesium chelatase family protein
VALLAGRRGIRRVILPRENGTEAPAVGEQDVIPVSYPKRAAGCLTGRLELEAMQVALDRVFVDQSACDLDLAGARGQEPSKRALRAAAGVHNLLMIGARTDSRLGGVSTVD